MMHQKELIGQTIKVDGKLRGEVVDETKHTVVVQTATERTRVLKHAHVFTIDGHTIDGNTLVGRPHERIKKKWQQTSKTLELQ